MLETEGQKGRFIGIFWAIFNLGGVMGAAVSLGQNFHSTVRIQCMDFLVKLCAHRILHSLEMVRTSRIISIFSHLMFSFLSTSQERHLCKPIDVHWIFVLC